MTVSSSSGSARRRVRFCAVLKNYVFRVTVFWYFVAEFLSLTNDKNTQLEQLPL